MVPWSQLRQPCLGWLLTIWLPNWHFSISNSSKSRVTALSVMHLFSRSPAAPAVPVNLTECFSASVKPVRTARNLFFVHAAFEGTYEQQHDTKTRQAHACGVAFSFDCFSGEVETFCASNSLELEQLFMPLRHDLTTVPKGNNARLLG